MKNPLETNKVAGAGVKVLPVDEKGAATENNLPPQILVPSARGADGHTGLDFGSDGSREQALVDGTAPILTALDLPSLTDARLRALDRTHDMMALHSMRLVESKMDALSVVIKPAIGTELSLELHQHGDAVEARATLLRGDHQLLSEHWSDLQQRLDQRGIKLGALNCGTGSPAGDQRQFQSAQTSQEEAAQQASAFAEFAITTAGGGATARQATLHDGWESWA
jgi:hypothetical protein